MTFLFKDNGALRVSVLIGVAAFAVVLGVVLFVFMPTNRVTYDGSVISISSSTASSSVVIRPIITHISTPDPVKAIYMTACTASEPRLRAADVGLVSASSSEANAIVIDIKDYTGTVSYASTTFQTNRDVRGCRIKYLPEFIAELHEKGVYVIGRVTVFQDPYYASHHIDVAIKNKKNPDMAWTDPHGLAYIDAGAKPFWEYIVGIAKEGYGIGFDEINFDYVRYPSDGALSDALYTWDGTSTKPMIIRDFFSYLHDELSPLGIPISADLFGQTTTDKGDMGIGQVLENALPYFDYIDPMVYPSHYIPGFLNYQKPAEHPYQVVAYSMKTAVERTIAASSSPAKLRPWLQAFDLGAIYTPAMVRVQIAASEDAGLSGWLLWNAGSRYQAAFLDPLTPFTRPIVRSASTSSTTARSVSTSR